MVLCTSDTRGSASRTRSRRTAFDQPFAPQSPRAESACCRTSRCQTPKASISTRPATTGLEAAATYDGGFRTRVALTTSGPVDLAHLVWLAAHETYPGHHVQHVLADRDCVRARGWRERELFPNFGRHHFHAEGAAEAGASLLLDGDVFAEICRALAPAAGVRPESVTDVVAVHRAVTALDIIVPTIAQQYLDGGISGEAATARLSSEALVPDAQQFLAAIERQRTRVLAYPVGRRVIERHIRRAGTTPGQPLLESPARCRFLLRSRTSPVALAPTPHFALVPLALRTHSALAFALTPHFAPRTPHFVEIH